MTVATDIQKIVSTAVEGLGYDFVGMDYTPAKNGPALRVYVDLIGGISISDCEQVSKHLSAVLNVELDGMDYSLEVSSPGLDRKLFTLEQCRSYEGSKVKLSLHTPVTDSDRKNFSGVLSSVDDSNIINILVDGKELSIDFVNVREIRLVPEIQVGKKKS